MSSFEKAWAALDGKKKWIGLILATLLLLIGRLTGEQWVEVFGIFCAVDGVVGVARAVKGGSAGG